jgi:7-carboxy-7-deazaguanine synthase
VAQEARGLWVSETFVSIQGEGPSQGSPAAFLRLGRCNLSCSFCDTPYTWDASRFDLEAEIEFRSLDDVTEWLMASSPGRIIVTGGEPMIQHAQLGLLFRALDDARTLAGQPLDVIEIETNGTIEPPAAFVERVQQFNVSPKLSNSGEPRERAIRTRALVRLSQIAHAYFKFVISSDKDADEALVLTKELGVPPERTLFMPLASDLAELRARQFEVAQLALANRVRFGSRLHLELFGGGRGV